MTKIDELTPGQLDHLTAEHIMGLDMESIDNYMVFEGETWQPTLNGNQALLLLEKAEERTGGWITLEPGWSVSQYWGYDDWETLSSGETAHVAICRAALKVFGYDPE